MIWLRYWVRLEGLDHSELRRYSKEGGVLFLPNHPALLDPVFLIARLWPKWKIRPMVVEASYFYPIVHWLLKSIVRAVKVPNFQYAVNSYKFKRGQDAAQEVIQGLKRGDNFVVYPAGRLRRTPEELIGGASAVHDILQAAPDTKVVLVRTVGLWGSSFSWGASGKQPYLSQAFPHGLRTILKNLIFFTPRRRVRVEFEPVPREFPRRGTRAELNGWLESWYNRPLSRLNTKGEPLTLVSYSRWKPELPAVTYKRPIHTADVADVPASVRNEVLKEISKVSKRRPSDIKPEMHLFTDVGLDSLDIAELISAIGRDQAFASGAHYDMLTVGGLMAIAADEHIILDGDDLPGPVKGWEDIEPRPEPALPEGETLHEAFLRCCDRMGEAIACADQVAGVVTYPKLKQGALMLAHAIRKMPGQRIGVMLPSSVAAQCVVLACWLAGKVPVMINWTVGPRFIGAMQAVTDVEQVITSWQFLDRAEGIDITPIHDRLITLEAMRSRFGVRDLLRAKRLARLDAPQLLETLHVERDGDAVAVILFTSGTEAQPKAVPLSHTNLLSNQRASLPIVGFRPDDSIFSILPPFHSLGFNVTGLVPLVTGAKAFYFPKPTEGRRMAIDIERYRPTIICTAPSFLRHLLGAVEKPEEIESLRLIVTGAEATPPQLFEEVARLRSQPVLIEGYGITECGPILTTNRSNEPSKGVGRPIEGVELLVVNPETYKPVGAGEVGLVLARGPNIFKGYLGWNQPHPFIAMDGQEWYNTGDLGSLDATGALTLAGRLKRFVKIGGEMISLPAMELALESAAQERGWGGAMCERQLAIVGSETQGTRPALHFFSNFFVDCDEVNDTLKELGFSNLARISHCHQMKEIPLMGSGKYDYRQLQRDLIEYEARG